MPDLPPHLIAALARDALLEDVGPGDVTTEAIVPHGVMARGIISAREELVVSGIQVAMAAFRLLDPELRESSSARDGDRLPPGGSLLDIIGSAGALLTAERTAMNFLGHLSGVATFTRACVDAVARAGGGSTVVADTRKTTPSMRILEKAAVASGGGTNHRFGLWDAVLIKDNHVDLAGGVARAVALARDGSTDRPTIETEVRNLQELEEAMEAGADAVLLDNFTLEGLEEATRKAAGRVLVEVSGGVSLETLPRIAALGVDRISMGALTHSAPSVDLTMRIEPWTS